MKPVHSTLKYLSHRDQLAAHLKSAGMTGRIVEVGTLYGAFARVLAKDYPGRVVCVDPWKNQPADIYHDGANLTDMEQVYQQAKIALEPLGCKLVREFSLAGAKQFKDGELDAVYLDGNHAVQSVRDDIEAWWPKVRIGGIVAGHDFFTRYDRDTNSDAATAVMELAERIGQRPHVTWCTSWYFVKTPEADARFRGQPLKAAPTIDRKKVEIVPVLAVTHADFHLALKWLQWVKALHAIRPLKRLHIWASKALPEDGIYQLRDLAQVIGKQVAISRPPEVYEKGYGASANYHFRTALEMVERQYPGMAMLWCESDTVPLQADWADAIEAEYRLCGKPFLGDLVLHRGVDPGIDHMTGTGVYPPDWRELAPSLAILPEPKPAQGWDSLCAHEILPQAAKAKTILQVWRPPAITVGWMRDNVPEAVKLFHQCKDGTMIDVLTKDLGAKPIPLTRPLPKYEPPKPVVASPDPTGVEIMVVACAKDKDFLKYCLESIRRHARGFAGVTLVVPEQEAAQFKWTEQYAKLRLNHEPPGKGMLAHEIAICRADEFCPDASAILHMDADCVFWEPASAGDYVEGGKCLIVAERMDLAISRNPNRALWTSCVQRATGILPTMEVMVRHPNVYPRDLYAHTRKIVEQNTGMEFNQFVLAQENGFPQGFAEFPTLGTVALRDMPQLFNVESYDAEWDRTSFGIWQKSSDWQYAYIPGRDHMVELWGHAGINRYKADLEAFAAGRLPKYYLK